MCHPSACLVRFSVYVVYGISWLRVPARVLKCQHCEAIGWVREKWYNNTNMLAPYFHGLGLLFALRNRVCTPTDYERRLKSRLCIYSLQCTSARYAWHMFMAGATHRWICIDIFLVWFGICFKHSPLCPQSEGQLTQEIGNCTFPTIKINDAYIGEKCNVYTYSRHTQTHGGVHARRSLCNKNEHRQRSPLMENSQKRIPRE